MPCACLASLPANAFKTLGGALQTHGVITSDMAYFVSLKLYYRPLTRAPATSLQKKGNYGLLPPVWTDEHVREQCNSLDSRQVCVCNEHTCYEASLASVWLYIFFASKRSEEIDSGSGLLRKIYDHRLCIKLVTLEPSLGFTGLQNNFAIPCDP